MRRELLDGLEVPVLPLARILASKRAAGRAKDLAAAHGLEDALLLLEQGEPRDE